MEAAPGEKAKKYDRQLRLWGEHGQEALETAKVCLINANATGTEILKNLILPGIGCFTVVDGKKVTGQDVGNNFFLTKESIGKSRAQVSTDLLLELNEDVSGDFVDETLENLLENNSVFFTGFSIVIACDVPEGLLLQLADLLYSSDTPLLICRSYGFIGYMRIVVKEHTVVESHPDSSLDDLRLLRPFPGLVQFCDSFDLDAMTKKEHSHTPWLIVVYKYLQKWKAEHDGEVPKNYREKNLFKELIQKGICTNDDGVPMDEENFDEALKNVNTALIPTTVPSEVQQIFSNPACTNLHTESKPFWILAKAVHEFILSEGQGMLPLRGSIPDMTADSERYIQLQNVYKQQAADHVTMVTGHLHQILETLGRDEPLCKRRYRSPGNSPAKPHENISDEDIKTFCKNTAFLRVVSNRSLEEEYNPLTTQATELASRLEDTDDDNTVFYVMLRAADKFYTEFSHYPGVESVEGDIPKLKSCLVKFLQELGVTQTVKDDFIHEVCRYGASELHSVAAYMGGVAAQEVIKVITKQFVPVNNTYIYNAMKQTSCTLQM